MQYDMNKKISELTVGEFMAVQKDGIKSLVKWGLLLFYGIPAAIFIGIAIFGFIMVRLAQSS